MAILAAIQSVLNAINNPVVKGGLAWVFGQVWARWPDTQKRAIPILTLAGSAVLGLGQIVTALAAVAAGGNQPTALAIAQAAGKVTVGWAIFDAVLGTLLPVVCATGTHSWVKNTLQWVRDGAHLFRQGSPATTKR